ncbi:MAG: glycosyltransferase family 4 protein [Maribacter arcticus]|jgi:glycosyltransferase involved in cell wall biosynthesis|uniref:glycosyltransferase family 4 protein n=1 Tax=Maribacter arcticus TaxID=561365 RepID=UPI003001E096
MKILYIHQYFNTPEHGGSTRSYWISQELIKNGHEVVLITSTRKKNEDGTKKVIDGIEIVYVEAPYSQNMGVFGRLKAFIVFMWKSTKVAFKQKSIALVIATSTPLTVGVPALLLKKIKGTPYLFEVRDLWPEVPIQMGALNNYFLRSAALWLENIIYKNAAHIVALSPGMAEGVLRKRIKNSKVTMIPNMSKIDHFFIRPHNLEVLNTHKLKKDNFKLVYFGSMGLSNGIDYILDTAKLLKSHTDIDFIFIGYGSMIEEMLEICKTENLENVHFLGRFGVAETSEIVNICNITLVTFANLPILYTNSPNKLFDSLSAGKPIIVNSKGWTKTMVESNQCGIYVDPESPTDFANKILELKKNPEQLALMGKNARKLAESTYDKSILCAQFAEVVDKLLPKN